MGRTLELFNEFYGGGNWWNCFRNGKSTLYKEIYIIGAFIEIECLSSHFQFNFIKHSHNISIKSIYPIKNVVIHKNDIVSH